MAKVHVRVAADPSKPSPGTSGGGASSDVHRSAPSRATWPPGSAGGAGLACIGTGRVVIAQPQIPAAVQRIRLRRPGGEGPLLVAIMQQDAHQRLGKLRHGYSEPRPEQRPAPHEPVARRVPNIPSAPTTPRSRR